jgi:hypothetical protein
MYDHNAKIDNNINRSKRRKGVSSLTLHECIGGLDVHVDDAFGVTETQGAQQVPCYYDELALVLPSPRVVAMEKRVVAIAGELQNSINILHISRNIQELANVRVVQALEYR